MSSIRCSGPLCILSCLWAMQLWAGGSGLNVVVVVNQASTNSVALGNYYCEKRLVPPQNLLRVNWSGVNTTWNTMDFTNYLLNPLLAMVSSRQLTDQIDYVVLSMDFPYQLGQGGDVSMFGVNSTSAAVYYGFKPDASADFGSCALPGVSSNSYAGSETIFRFAHPSTAPTNSFLTMMITSSNLAEAEAIIDRGVASDSSFPTQPVVLAKTSDVFRNIRYLTSDNAIFDTRLRGNYAMYRTNSDFPSDSPNILGYETGLYHFSVPSNTFVPGAIADTVTSFAGLLYEPNSQTNLLVFLNAGATASYGTVVEPCAYFEKFPSPQTYFYQARGFSVAECYYQGLTNPYQGIMVGEPLAAPFAQPASAFWVSPPPDAILSGITNLSVQFAASDMNHPIQQVDLFVDGLWQQTLTNIPPATGNLLEVNLNGHAIDYIVPSGASIQTVASGLSDTLNSSASTNIMKVVAIPHGDRIELRSTDPTTVGEQISASASSSVGSASNLTTFVSASLPQFLDTIASGIRGFAIIGNPTNDSFLNCMVTKPDSTQLLFGVTNSAGTLTLTQMALQLLNLINSNPSLQMADGLKAQDFITDVVGPNPPEVVEFYLVANTPGWKAAEIHADLSGSTDFTIIPSASGNLDANLSDLQPRNHLYVMAGLTNLPLTFSLDTTSLANGYHELAAVVYEGSHVRTQQRTSRTIIINNNPLSALFSVLNPGTNVDLGSNLEFGVVANTTNVNQVQLFSTGGLVGSTNQASAAFSVPSASLGIGLHPFYALVTASTGATYRTETKWLRIVPSRPALVVSLTTPPPTLSWPTIPGQTYEVLVATNLAVTFQVAATLTPSNSPAQWTDTNEVTYQRFYRVRTSN